MKKCLNLTPGNVFDFSNRTERTASRGVETWRDGDLEGWRGGGVESGASGGVCELEDRSERGGNGGR